MPIYMDAHLVPGVKAREVAKAHHQDLLLQDEYGCKCMTYWVDEQRETIFCLVDAVDKDAVRNLHNKAHGLVPNKIIEVSSSIVQSFLGRIYDPEHAVLEEGLKVFSEASYRYLLVIQVTDIILLQHQLGADETNALLQKIGETIRKNALEFDGAEAEHGGEGFILSFTSSLMAVRCALSILKDLTSKEKQLAGFRAAINGGEPVENSSKLFGDTVSFASTLSMLCSGDMVAIAAAIRERVATDILNSQVNSLFSLNNQDEDFLRSLNEIMEEHWQDSGYDIPEYSQAMAMSQSQLYRKCIAVTGESCNSLLKNFRLEKARELLKKKKYSIAQVTFECGFSSPSYFTKCFKAQYGLLPHAYTGLTS